MRWLLLCFLLAACAASPAPRPLTTCPPVRTYSVEEQNKVAEEMQVMRQQPMVRQQLVQAEAKSTSPGDKLALQAAIAAMPMAWVTPSWLADYGAERAALRACAQGGG